MSLDAPAPDEASPQVREVHRLAALADYDLADMQQAAAAGEELTEHASFAQLLTGAQGAAINIIGDTYQQTIATADGVLLPTMDRNDSICGRVIDATGPGDVYIARDASQDSALRDSPWVSGESASIRFYAGAALVGTEGLPLGMLCVFSTEPVSDEAAERAAQRLLPIRDSVVAALETRRSAGHLTLEQNLEVDLIAELAPHGPPIDDVIDDVIDTAAVHTLFQPIVHLGTGSVVAFDARTHGPPDTELESPTALVNAARETGRLGELDWLSRTGAMRAALDSGLPWDLAWFIDVERAGLDTQCPQRLRPILDQARAELRVVSTVVERDVEDHVGRLMNATDQARRDAWGVAVNVTLNDFGGASSSLGLLSFLQPDIVQLEMSVLRQASSAVTADITAAVRAYAERTGAVILAKDIETREDEEVAKIYGAGYGQGPLYGRPAPLPTFLSPPQQPISLRQQPTPTLAATPFEALLQTIKPQRGRRDHFRHIFNRLHRCCQVDNEGAVMLALFDTPEPYFDNLVLFEAAAERNALTVCFVPNIAVRQSNLRCHVGPLPPTSRLRDECAMLVITPHQASALVLRHTGETADDGTPLVDYIYSHDRRAVVAAARAYLAQGFPG